MSRTAKQHFPEDQECLIFVGNEIVAFDSIDSAIDTLAREGILVADEKRMPLTIAEESPLAEER
jgi:hypothetical protein